MIILGIDPGTVDVGLAVVRISPDELTCHEWIHRGRRETAGEFFITIRPYIQNWIHVWEPELIACESAHINPKFVQAGMKISECIGVVESVAAEEGVPLTAVQPARWKLAITGNAGAGYDLVRICLRNQLSLSRKDAEDLAEHELAAIAIALTAGRIRETERKLGGGTK